MGRAVISVSMRTMALTINFASMYLEGIEVLDSVYDPENNQYNYLVQAPQFKTQKPLIIHHIWVKRDGTFEFKIVPENETMDREEWRRL